MSNNTAQQKQKKHYYVKEESVSMNDMTLEECIAEITELFEEAMEDVLRVNNVKRPYYNIEIPDGHPFELRGSLYSSGDDESPFMSFIVTREETDEEMAKRLEDEANRVTKAAEIKYQNFLELQEYYSDISNIPTDYYSTHTI
jgi:hypothetical protein